MTAAKREFSWRQGDVLTDEAAETLNLLTPDISEQRFVVVISHDCDLSAETDREPDAEVIVGRRIDKLGGDSYGKTARRLHITYETDGEPVVLELMATSKRSIRKSDLFASTPRQCMRLDGQGIGILQRWLASRYYRSAFPEMFENRLREAKIPGKRTFIKKIENVLTDEGEYIRALLFDLDEGKCIERTNTDDIYLLGIVVLYDSKGDEPRAAESANKVAEALEGLFESAFHNSDAGWKNICLLYCDPISDSAITVAQKEMLKQWRLEHMSLQENSPQPMLTP